MKAIEIARAGPPELARQGVFPVVLWMSLREDCDIVATKLHLPTSKCSQ